MTTEGGEEGGLLASCRLNTHRVKEMEREAIFRDNLLFFIGWSRKQRENETNSKRAKESKGEEKGSNIPQRSRFKVTGFIT